MFGGEAMVGGPAHPLRFGSVALEEIGRPFEAGADLQGLASGSIVEGFSGAGVGEFGAGPTGVGADVEDGFARLAVGADEPGSGAPEVQAGPGDLELAVVDRDLGLMGLEGDLADVQDGVVIGRESCGSWTPVPAFGATHD